MLDDEEQHAVEDASALPAFNETDRASAEG